MNEYPVGTVVASDKMAYIKKSRKVGYRNFEEYWIGTEGWACPFYGDSQVNQWIENNTHKVLRLGTNE